VSYLLVQLWGAGGAGATQTESEETYNFGGGAGGYTQCYLQVKAGEKLNVVVGGGGLTTPFSPDQGDCSDDALDCDRSSIPSAYGGGGGAITWITWVASGGGGRSSIQRKDEEEDLVAAGGGGGGGEYHSGYYDGAGISGGGGGGGMQGLSSGTSGGGSQTGGGSGGSIGSLSCTPPGARYAGGTCSGNGGGGGGGGFFGGGAGDCIMYGAGGGGGGSGYIGGCLAAAAAFTESGSSGGMSGQAATFNSLDASYQPGIALGGLPGTSTSESTNGNGGNGLVVISPLTTRPSLEYYVNYFVDSSTGSCALSSTTCNLRACITAFEGLTGICLLAPGVHSVSLGSFLLTTANSDLKITSLFGPYSASIDGSASIDENGAGTQFMTVRNTSATLRLEGITIQSFSFSSESTSSTGILSLDSGTGIINNCIFRENAARSCPALNANINRPFYLTLTNTLFQNNQATTNSEANSCNEYGASVCLLDNIGYASTNAPLYTISNCSFVGNKGGCSGGEAVAVDVGNDADSDNIGNALDGSIWWYPNGMQVTIPCKSYSCLVNPCSAGSYLTYDSSSGISTCQSCAAGSVTNTLASAGATSCTPCSAGKYSSVSTQPCTPCPVSSTSLQSGSTFCVLYYAYTGSVQRWVVPAGIAAFTVDAYGAAGGCYDSNYTGGLGGHISVSNITTSLFVGQTLFIYVGGAGVYDHSSLLGGGGSHVDSTHFASGGGATDLRTNASDIHSR